MVGLFQLQYPVYSVLEAVDGWLMTDATVISHLWLFWINRHQHPWHKLSVNDKNTWKYIYVTT